MSEDPLIEIEEELTKYWPTVEQNEISLSNCKKIYDPHNKMESGMLFKFLDDGCLEYGKITLMSFIINTCEKILETVEDKDEGENIIKLVCEYFNSPYHDQEQQVLSSRIYSLLCCPIELYENAAFVQIWGDIFDRAITWREEATEIYKNDFNPYEFPFTLSECYQK